MKKLFLTIILLTTIIDKSQTTELKIDDFNVISKANLKRLIYVLKIQHESANFKSKIFKENNNLFGMKMPKRRKTMAIGINRGHAKYSSWQASVIDYKLMQKRYAHNKSRNQYFVYLRKYAQDPNYVNKIKRRL